jgi:hypothetical protein
MNILIQTTEIALDLSCRGEPVRIYAKQGDIDSRRIRACFYSGGRIFSLDDVGHSEIRVKKPDGTITVNGGESDGSGIVFPLTDQSINVSGEGSVDFLLYGNGGELISAVPAKITIIESPVGSDAIESTDEYAAFTAEFTQHVKSYDEFKTQATASFSSLGSQIGKINTNVSAIDERLTANETKADSTSSSLSALRNDYYTSMTAFGKRVSEDETNISANGERITALENRVGKSTVYAFSSSEVSVTGTAICSVKIVPPKGRSTLVMTSAVSGVFACVAYSGETVTGAFEDGVCNMKFDGDGETAMTAYIWTQFGETYTGVPADDFTATLKSGLSFELTTKTAYDSATSHSPTTVYYVLDGNKVTQYLGDTKLSSGSAAAGSATENMTGTAESLIGTIN